MPRFEVVSGKHKDRQGRVWTKGEVLHSHEDLAGKFRNKFRELPAFEPPSLPAEAQQPLPPSETPTAPKKKLSVKKKASSGAEARGTEVTGVFPLLAEHGLKAFTRDKHHHVYKGDSPEPINPKPLKASEVEAFVKGWLEE